MSRPDEGLAAENVQLRALVAGLREINEALSERVTQLEARLGQGLRNSHKPPSSEGYEKPAPRSRCRNLSRSMRPVGV